MSGIDELKARAETGNLILSGVPEKIYHAFPALSYSGLKELAKAPGYFKWFQENPDTEDTTARRIGRLTHMAIAEPDRIGKEVVAIDGNRNATAVKEQIAEAEMNGKTVTKTEELSRVLKVAEYCRKHPVVSGFLKEGRGEQTLLWKDAETGVQCKARADWLTPGLVIADWKTFDNLSDTEIERQIRRMKYQWQCGFYTEGLSVITNSNLKLFANVFIRTEDPIDCRVVVLSDHDIEEARTMYRKHIHKYAECLEADHWPLSEPVVTDMTLKPFFD